MIEWIKHTTVVNTSEKKISLDELTNALREVIQRRKSCVLKCMDIDYNLLPFAVFLLKMSHTIYYTNNSTVQIGGALTVMAAFLACEVFVPLVSFVHRLGSKLYELTTRRPSDADILSDSEP